MPICEPKQLSAQIRKGELQNLYYIYGADLVQVKQLTASLLKKATGGNPDMALTRFDGQKLELKALEDAARQFSMFSAYNCIQVHNLDANTLREDQLKQLLELLSDVGGATVLVFDVTGFDPKNGKKTPQGKNKKLIDGITKHGVVCEAVQRTPQVLAKELSELAEKVAKYNFKYIHKSYIINSIHVKHFTARKVIMNNGHELPVSRTNRENIKHYE